MRISTWIQKYKDMSQPVKASFWFTVCNILNKGIALISTPVFVRILTTDEYGDYSVFQSWYSILVIFAWTAGKKASGGTGSAGNGLQLF